MSSTALIMLLHLLKSHWSQSRRKATCTNYLMKKVILLGIIPRINVSREQDFLEVTDGKSDMLCWPLHASNTFLQKESVLWSLKFQLLCSHLYQGQLRGVIPFLPRGGVERPTMYRKDRFPPESGFSVAMSLATMNFNNNEYDKNIDKVRAMNSESVLLKASFAHQFHAAPFDRDAQTCSITKNSMSLSISLRFVTDFAANGTSFLPIIWLLPQRLQPYILLPSWQWYAVCATCPVDSSRPVTCACASWAADEADAWGFAIHNNMRLYETKDEIDAHHKSYEEFRHIFLAAGLVHLTKDEIIEILNELLA